LTAPAWKLPEPEIRLFGEVRYRCHECGELIDAESAVLVGSGKETRSYHPTHIPALEVLTDGRSVIVTVPT
jgi:hypothetical protein